MVAAKCVDVTGFSRTDSMLADEVLKGVEGTLKRIRSARSTSGYSPLAMGQILEFVSLDDKAADAYSKAFNDEDRNVAMEALARYVIALLKQDRRTDALNAAERLARIDPKYKVVSVISGETYSSMTLLGEALFLNERLDDAERAYKAALKTLPNDPFVSGRLALLYLATGKSQQAAGLKEAAASSSRYTDLTNTLELVSSGMLVANINARSAIAIITDSQVGRPFRVDELRIASLVERDDWA